MFAGGPVRIDVVPVSPCLPPGIRSQKYLRPDVILSSPFALEDSNQQ